MLISLQIYSCNLGVALTAHCRIISWKDHFSKVLCTIKELWQELQTLNFGSLNIEEPQATWTFLRSRLNFFKKRSKTCQNSILTVSAMADACRMLLDRGDRFVQWIGSRWTLAYYQQLL